jgi:hypothetical protein
LIGWRMELRSPMGAKITYSKLVMKNWDKRDGATLSELSSQWCVQKDFYQRK